MLRLDSRDLGSIPPKLDSGGLLYQPVAPYRFYDDVALGASWKCFNRYSLRVLEEFSRDYPCSVSGSAAAVYQSYLDKTGLDAALSYSSTLDGLNDFPLGNTASGSLLRGLDEAEKLARGLGPYSIGDYAREEARKNALMLDPNSLSFDWFGKHGKAADFVGGMSVDDFAEATRGLPATVSIASATSVYQDSILAAAGMSLLGDVSPEGLSSICGDGEYDAYKGEAVDDASPLGGYKYPEPPLIPPPAFDFKEDQQRREEADNEKIRKLDELSSKYDDTNKSSRNANIISWIGLFIACASLLVSVFSKWDVGDLISFVTQLFG